MPGLTIAQAIALARPVDEQMLEDAIEAEVAWWEMISEIGDKEKGK